MSTNPSQPSPTEALLRGVLERVANGDLTVDEAMPQIQQLTGSAAATFHNFATLLRPAIERQKAAGAWILGGIFATIGTIFFIIGAGLGWKSTQFIGAPSVPGEIVAVAGGVPVAKYEVKNVPYRVTGSMSTQPPVFRVGEKVTILYQADDPADAQIDAVSERWLFLIIFGGIGLVIGGIGWSILFFKTLARLFRSHPVNPDGAERFTVE